MNKFFKIAAIAALMTISATTTFAQANNPYTNLTITAHIPEVEWINDNPYKVTAVVTWYDNNGLIEQGQNPHIVEVSCSGAGTTVELKSSQTNSPTYVEYYVYTSAPNGKKVHTACGRFDITGFSNTLELINWWCLTAMPAPIPIFSESPFAH